MGRKRANQETGIQPIVPFLWQLRKIPNKLLWNSQVVCLKPSLFDPSSSQQCRSYVLRRDEDQARRSPSYNLIIRTRRWCTDAQGSQGRDQQRDRQQPRSPGPIQPRRPTTNRGRSLLNQLPASLSLFLSRTCFLGICTLGALVFFGRRKRDRQTSMWADADP